MSARYDSARSIVFHISESRFSDCIDPKHLQYGKSHRFWEDFIICLLRFKVTLYVAEGPTRRTYLLFCCCGCEHDKPKTRYLCISVGLCCVSSFADKAKRQTNLLALQPNLYKPLSQFMYSARRHIYIYTYNDPIIYLMPNTLLININPILSLQYTAFEKDIPYMYTKS